MGSYAYNVTMSLGMGALIDPISINDSNLIRAPYLAMVALMALALALSARHNHLNKRHGWILLAAYPAFITVVLLA